MTGIATLVMAAFVGATSAPEQVRLRQSPSPRCVVEAINQLRAGFEAAVNKQDAAAVAGYYADDGVLMPPNGQPVDGRQQIETFYKNTFETKATLQLESLECRVSGDLGFDAGTTRLEEGKGPPDAGKFVVVLKRVGTAWLIEYSIFNNEQRTRPK